MPIKPAYVLNCRRQIGIEIDQNTEDRQAAQAAFTAVQRLLAE